MTALAIRVVFVARLLLLAFGQMGIPSATRLGLDLCEAGAGRRIGNSNEMLTTGTLNLASGELRFALERLVAMRAIELEFGGSHSAYLHKRKSRGKSISKFLSILFISS